MQTAVKDSLPAIVERLVQEFDPEEIILFGSRAWGEPRPDGDYDLFVVVPDGRENCLHLVVKAHQSLGGLGISKDIVVSTRKRFDRLSQVPASSEAALRDRGVVLYERVQV